MSYPIYNPTIKELFVTMLFRYIFWQIFIIAFGKGAFCFNPYKYL